MLGGIGGGPVASVAASYLQSSQFSPELELLFVWSFCACSPYVHVGFLQVLQFPPTSQEQAGNTNVPVGVN